MRNGHIHLVIFFLPRLRCVAKHVPSHVPCPTRLGTILVRACARGELLLNARVPERRPRTLRLETLHYPLVVHDHVHDAIMDASLTAFPELDAVGP